MLTRSTWRSPEAEAERHGVGARAVGDHAMVGEGQRGEVELPSPRLLMVMVETARPRRQNSAVDDDLRRRRRG